MKYLIAISLITLVVFSNCSDSLRDQQNNIIIELETKLTNDTSLVLNKNIALDLSRNYDNFASQFPKDSLAPDYLFKAGEITMNLNMGSKSIEYFNRLINQYPNFNKLPETVFLKAFVYENLIEDLEKATETYNQFMKNHPDHILYKDAKASISNMGKSLEDIIKEFEEKNKD